MIYMISIIDITNYNKNDLSKKYMIYQNMFQISLMMNIKYF